MQDDPANPPTVIPFESTRSVTRSSPASSAPPTGLLNHRLKLAARAHAILDQFWTDADVDESIRTIQLEGWIDSLETLTEDEIRVAWAVYQNGGPRTAGGRLARPDAGALFRIALLLRQGRGDPNPIVTCRRALDPATINAEEERQARILRWKRIAAEGASATEPKPEEDAS